MMSQKQNSHQLALGNCLVFRHHLQIFLLTYSDVWNRFFYFSSVSRKNLDSVQNEFGAVWFEKMWFSSDVSYYLPNRRVDNLQQILQH